MNNKSDSSFQLTVDLSDRFPKPLKALRCLNTDYELRRMKKQTWGLLPPQKRGTEYGSYGNELSITQSSWVTFIQTPLSVVDKSLLINSIWIRCFKRRGISSRSRTLIPDVCKVCGSVAEALFLSPSGSFEGRATIEGATVTLKRVTQEDAGEYRCEISAPMDTVVLGETNVTLKVLGTAAARLGSTDVAIGPGAALTPLLP